LGIGGTDLMKTDIRAIPAVTFQSLFTVSSYVNEKYDLGFDNELSAVLNQYKQKNVNI